MKKIIYGAAIALVALIGIAATNNTSDIEGFSYGNPEIAAINSMSFSPEGVLFVGDSKNAAIYALNIKDAKATGEVKGVNLRKVDEKIATALGTTVENIRINDMVVNPVSKMPYFGVNITDGTPVLLRLNGENFENVSLNAIDFSKIGLNDACLLYTSPSPRDKRQSRMPSSA